MADEKCCLHDNDDTKPIEIIEETSVETMPLIDENIQEEDVLPLLTPTSVSNNVSLRRHSTGVSDKLVPSKAQTRYRGNQMSSTHDLCKHGKRREDDLVVKPWELLVKKKNVESGDLVKSESLGVMRKSLGSETKSSTLSDSTAKKTNLDAKKVSRSNEKKSPKVDPLKSMNKEKIETDEPVKCEEEVSEKTLYVVESNIEDKMMKKKSIKSEIQQSSEKKILRSNQRKSLALLPSLIPSLREVKEPRLTKSDPRPIRQTTTSKSKTSLSEKKESSSENSVTKSKTESKIRPKSIGLKSTPPPPRPQIRPVSFKKGKVLEPKVELSTPTLIKFKKRVVVQEPKLRSDVNKKKKNLKDKREGVGKMSYTTNGEGKREKVVLRHRKVEAKKKLQTLFNNVIEETVNKLEDVRKSKVKALVGAFETVISLQDNDNITTSQKKKKVQSKSTPSQVIEG